MSNGFLGNDASFMLDVVVCALVLVVPALLTSVYLVKVHKNYLVHRNMQVTLGVVLVVGMLSCVVAVIGALRVPLLPALKAER